MFTRKVSVDIFCSYLVLCLFKDELWRVYEVSVTDPGPLQPAGCPGLDSVDEVAEEPRVDGFLVAEKVVRHGIDVRPSYFDQPLQLVLGTL